MQCSKCLLEITDPVTCPKCGINLCSLECLFHHKSQCINSSTGISEITNSNKTIIKSTIENGIIPSFNNSEIIYDSMYDLKNFLLICEKDGKPRKIGRGSFGEIYLAENIIDKKIYAIKHMIKRNAYKYLPNLDQLHYEIDIQSRINHPNIIKLFYAKETEEFFDIVLEYAPCGTLFDYVIKCKGLPEKIAYKYYIQVVKAIKFLHENNIIHRDIKPENILMFENDIVKLCDFGWAIKCEKKLKAGTFSGTTEYLAPEIINNLSYGKELDLWTLGIFLYELMHGISPFRPHKQKFKEFEVLENIKLHKILFYVPVSEEAKKLIFGLLEVDDKKRCTMEGILKSDFVKKYEKENNNEKKNSDDKNVNENKKVKYVLVNNITKIREEKKIKTKNDINNSNGKKKKRDYSNLIKELKKEFSINSFSKMKCFNKYESKLKRKMQLKNNEQKRVINIPNKNKSNFAFIKLTKPQSPNKNNIFFRNNYNFIYINNNYAPSSKINPHSQQEQNNNCISTSTNNNFFNKKIYMSLPQSEINNQFYTIEKKNIKKKYPLDNVRQNANKKFISQEPLDTNPTNRKRYPMNSPKKYLNYDFSYSNNINISRIVDKIIQNLKKKNFITDKKDSIMENKNKENISINIRSKKKMDDFKNINKKGKKITVIKLYNDLHKNPSDKVNKIRIIKNNIENTYKMDWDF